MLEVKESIIQTKSENLALRVVRLVKYIRKTKREYTMTEQLLRSGTSVGANVAESKYAQTDPDFYTKLCVALKECHETEYWVRLLFRSDYLNEREYTSISKDCAEVRAILSSITKTLKERGTRKSVITTPNS